jgi:hypothetical protein
MTQKLFAIFLTCMAFALSSCESDKITSTPNTNDSTALEKKLIVEPARLEAEQYDRYTLKARVTNVPISEVAFEWDFDEGFGFQPGEWTMNVEFTQNKIHNVRVKALDFFTNKLIDEDTIRVDVRPKTIFARFDPDSFVVEVNHFRMNTDGSLNIPAQVPMFYKTSSPPQAVAIAIDWGDGATSFDSLGQSHLFHAYLFPDTFQIILTAYEKFGVYLGADTGKVFFRMPSVTQYGVGTAASVDVYLVIDSLHPLKQDSLLKNPFALRIDQHGADAVAAYDDRNFSVFLDRYSGPVLHDTISGTFANNFQILQSLHVGVNETQTSPSASLRYSFDLQNLELLAVTTKEIVYRSKTPLLDDFLKNVSFSAEGTTNTPSGTFGKSVSIGIDNIPATKPGVFAIVVFNYF